VFVIETVSVVILPFNEVSEQFAFEEGEGEQIVERLANCSRELFSP
jgi:uncharacterized protein YhfF